MMLKIFQRFSKTAKKFVDKPTDYAYKLEAVRQFPKLKPFRVIDLEGNLIAKEYADVPKEDLVKIFDTMVAVNVTSNYSKRSKKWIASSICRKDRAKSPSI